MSETANGVHLRRVGDQILLSTKGRDEPVPVRVVWARPVSGRGAEVSFLNEDKQEVLMLRGLDSLDAESRRLRGLYTKWFQRRLPNGQRLDLPMSPQLENILRTLGQPE